MREETNFEAFQRLIADAESAFKTNPEYIDGDKLVDVQFVLSPEARHAEIVFTAERTSTRAHGVGYAADAIVLEDSEIIVWQTRVPVAARK